MENGNIITTENGLSVLVDYIAFTCMDIPYKDVFMRFGLSESEFQVHKGAYGYKACLRHNFYPVSVMYDGSDDMGVHVTVTGSAVDYFVECFKKSRPYEPTPFGDELAYTITEFYLSVLSEILDVIHDIGHLTRLDLAIDDKGAHYFTMDDVSSYFNDGLWVSKFKSYQETVSKGKGGKRGHTVYVGSRKSPLMLRIYDKALEQKKSDVKEWVRWEIEFHKERADAVAALIVGGNSLADVVFGILSNYLRFVVRDNVRDSRCTTCERWERFMNGVEKLRIARPIREKSLEEKRDWIKKQVAPTLAACVYADGGDMEFLSVVLEIGRARMTESLHELVREELKKNGIDVNGII